MRVLVANKIKPTEPIACTYRREEGKNDAKGGEMRSREAFFLSSPSLSNHYSLSYL